MSEVPEKPDLFADTTPDVVNAGDTLDIRFEDASKANQTVTIEIVNGGPQYHDIELDGDGKGSLPWVVPDGWDAIYLKHPDSAPHAVGVG